MPDIPTLVVGVRSLVAITLAGGMLALVVRLVAKAVRRRTASSAIDARLVAPCLAIAGWLSSSATLQERTRCRNVVHAAATRDSTLVVQVEQVTAGTRGARSVMLRGITQPASVAQSRCAVPAIVRLAPDTANAPPAGRIVKVHGRVLATTTGVRLDAGRIRSSNVQRSGASVAARLASAPRQTLLRWRAHLGETIDRHFRARAPLVRALLVADQQGIAPEIRDRYADAGLVHMLSVSGMHVAIIASALLTLGGLLRIPRRWLEPIAMGIVLLYVLLLGCPAPAVRSAVMLIVVAISRQWQRPVHSWTALALGAVVPTVDPLIVADLGWQLSVGGMAALVAARALLRRWRGARPAARVPSARSSAPPNPSARIRLWLFSRACSLGAKRGVAGWLISEIATGVLATILTAPIIAWTFGRLSLIAPLSNIAAGPVVAILQPALFLALLWALVTPDGAASWLPDATQPLMALFDGLARLFSSVPGAVLPVSLTLAAATGLGAAVALFVRGTASRRSTPWLLASAAAVVCSLWVPVAHHGSGLLELHVIDVGQGDALAVRTPHGHWILIDAGRRWEGGDAGRRTIVPYVRRHGGDVALFVLSHPHDDHAGGAASAVRALSPKLWWEPAFVTTSAGYREALQAVRETAARWERVRPGRRFAIDQVAFTVLAPDSSWTAAQHDANETSVVLRVEYGIHRLLLTGDAERNEEAWLVQRYGRDELTADVLKLGHHGSRTSSTVEFLAAVSPRLAIASVGAGNRYGHPAPETLANLLWRDVPVLRTDLEGTIVVRSDGRRLLTVEAAGDRWIIPAEQRVE